MGGGPEVAAAPLVGLRVLAIEQFGAGPWATLQLADLGADVIKIEDPRRGGDVGRRVPPYEGDGDSLYFESFNRGKRSVALSLTEPDGRSLFEELVRSADAVFSNLRGDGATKLGLRYVDLAETNPAIVCCALSAFGSTGPRATEGGYDVTVQGIAGWQSLTGGPEDPPMRSGVSAVDYAAGYAAALALLAAVWRAKQTGVGCDIDLSLFEIALSQLNYISTWVASSGYEPSRRPRSGHQSLVPFENFPTADGWVVIACPNERLWEMLCDALGRPEWAADERFADFAARDRHRSALVELIDEVLRSEESAAWIDRLTTCGIPCAPINDVDAALTDKQSVARGVVGDYEHPRFGAVRQVRTPFVMEGVQRQMQPAPRLGESNEEVQRETALPGVQTWTVGGAIEVSAVPELEVGRLFQGLITAALPTRVVGLDWLIPDYADRHGRLRALVQSFVIRCGSELIVVDTGVGGGKDRVDVPEWKDLDDTFLQRFSDLGVTPEDVTTVVCTHLHVDHVGWNTRMTRRRWVPTFPRARYVFVKDEFDHWSRCISAAAKDAQLAFADSVLPIVDAGVAEFVSGDFEIAPGIRLVRTPGHSPAHVSVALETERERALITGDVLHHPCQIGRPKWRTDVDYDPQQAQATRERVLAEAAADGTLLIGSHFAKPVAGRVEATQAGFKFVSTRSYPE